MIFILYLVFHGRVIIEHYCLKKFHRRWYEANLLTDLSYHLITPNTSGSIYNVVVLVQAIALYEHKECRIIVLLHFYTCTISQYGLSKSLVSGYWAFVQFVIGQIVQFLTAQFLLLIGARPSSIPHLNWSLPFSSISVPRRNWVVR